MDTTTIARLAVVVVATSASFVAMGIAVHYYRHRLMRRDSRQQPISDDRLARLEQSVDAIAIEVERITEGQRFLTRLHTSAPDALPDVRRIHISERREITPVS